MMTSPAGQGLTPIAEERGDNEDKSNPKKNKLFCKIQMDIKVCLSSFIRF